MRFWTFETGFLCCYVCAFSFLLPRTLARSLSKGGCKVTLVSFDLIFALWVFQCFLKEPELENVNSHWLYLFVFYPVCVFKCRLKFSARENVKPHWLHLIGFSPVCVFKCRLKSHSWTDAKSHWLHLFSFSPLCIFKCLLKAWA